MGLLYELFGSISHVDNSEDLVDRVGEKARAIRAEPDVNNFIFMVAMG